MQKEKISSCLVDTNIFVYAIGEKEGEKGRIAKQIVEKYISNAGKKKILLQNMAELFNVVKKRHGEGETLGQCMKLIEALLRLEDIEKISYNGETLSKAMKISSEYKKPFWDCLIAATMIENNVRFIYTENVSDFAGIEGIEALNPFVKKKS